MNALGGGDSSVLLWVASACVALIGARAFLECYRRAHFEGPLQRWREWLFAAIALVLGLWSAMVIELTAQGVGFKIGYHPVKLFGALALLLGTTGAVLFWATFKPLWFKQVAAVALLAVLITTAQISVLWSIGAEPGLVWRAEPLVFAVLVQFAGMLVAVRMVSAIKRGSRADAPTRRLLAALVLAACTVAAQELVMTASDMANQVVSGYAHMMPEVAASLIAGAVVPITLLLMLVDQRAQRRVRAAQRAQKRWSSKTEDAAFTDSMLPADTEQRPQP